YAGDGLILGGGGEAEVGRRARVPDVSPIPGPQYDRALAVPVEQVRAAHEAALGVLAGLGDVGGRPELEPLRLCVGFDALPAVPMVVPSIISGKVNQVLPATPT